jgi:hypothetical protein
MRMKDVLVSLTDRMEDVQSEEDFKPWYYVVHIHVLVTTRSREGQKSCC